MNEQCEWNKKNQDRIDETEQQTTKKNLVKLKFQQLFYELMKFIVAVVVVVAIIIVNHHFIDVPYIFVVDFIRFSYNEFL